MKWIVLSLAAVASALQILPPVHFDNTGSGHNKGFSLATTDRTIYLSADFASWKDQNGLTLLPPSASDFANTFRDDLQELTNSSWELRTVKQFPKHASGIFLGRTDHPDRFTYESGRQTEEGYELEIQDGSVFIRGSGARGMWWGTRTLLQQLVLTRSSLQPGRVEDAPAYATRGFLLDAGRKWYSLEFLKDLCTYASFFKLSEFHYHATDNYPLSRGRNVTWNEVYSQFSLHPESEALRPLVQRANETLSRAEFDDFQRHCAQRGVTVIPEIESPGHCLTVTKWRPELALESRDLLNLSHPDTVPLMKSIWTEFLPWFHTKEVHIGADEYDSEFADDYVEFVNEMSRFVQAASGKSVRIWGTYEPSNIPIDKNVTIQHWQYGQSDPVNLAQNGYQIINSEDWWAYMSLKSNHVPITPAPYPQFFNNARVLNFADQHGWQWTPGLFNPVNKTEQPDTEAVLGALLAAWNDSGPDATTQLEAYYAIRDGIPVVASRVWCGARGPPLHEPTLAKSIAQLSSQAVGQNLDRRVPGERAHGSGTLLSWTRPTTSQDKHNLGYGSKGMDYTLQLNVTGPFSLQSSDATLTLSSDGELAFVSDGWPYPLRSVAEADAFDEDQPGRIWVNKTTSTHKAVIIPRKSQVTISTNEIYGSRVWVDGDFVGRFEVFIYGGKNKNFSWSQMAFVAPLDILEGPGLQHLAVFQGSREG
ncbi:CAZyme family GH20 [Penicillium roqueforti]|nr:CAZyme family GH20 [Penicillium roqueforti]KAI2688382.1 CAZyme family GH20 [Penicillium roqueforti]KAI2700559.1 CAZyme family GH20 [Penicillium roqueforti]KAI3148947.1 CAZyme family GH20 [Penicillium roqueforti]